MSKFISLLSKPWLALRRGSSAHVWTHLALYSAFAKSLFLASLMSRVNTLAVQPAGLTQKGTQAGPRHVLGLLGKGIWGSCIPRMWSQRGWLKALSEHTACSSLFGMGDAQSQTPSCPDLRQYWWGWTGEEPRVTKFLKLENKMNKQ